jgi:soluble lytic murein transglycosylase-like protein
MRAWPHFAAAASQNHDNCDPTGKIALGTPRQTVYLFQSQPFGYDVPNRQDVPMPLTRRAFASLAATAVLLTACGKPAPVTRAATYSGNTPEMQALIRTYAELYDIPESLIHRVIIRESGYNPAARNGPYYGLMQILPATARTMGYQGPPSGLLDAETNLKYAGKYLRGAWMVSGGSESKAVMWYAKGYYYEAKRKGLLEETGLRA